MNRSQTSADLRQELGELAQAMDRIAPERTVVFMEVCGTHTMSFRRNGLQDLVPDRVQLISGPGCPVCVTPVEYVDHAVALAQQREVILATFGDLVRVPGSYTSLEHARAEGAQVEVVYSPLDALNLARKHPDRQVVFLAVGFETTAPVVAASVIQAEREHLENYSALSAHKVIPPAMLALAQADDLALDGFMCPGHVSVVIGMNAYAPIAQAAKLPCVVTGFEPTDMLQGLLMLVSQARQETAKVENQYLSVVRPEGNPRARAAMDQVFEVCDSRWRGLGNMPLSGLTFRKEYARFENRSLDYKDVPPQIEEGNNEKREVPF